MRLIMMGTGGYAVPTFEALLDSTHTVAALVTKPPAGKKKKPAPVNPMRQAAEARGLALFDPESVNSPEAHELLAALDAELFVVCDYGQILSPETLALAKHGGINLHASLLPKYRGAAPINWAIYNGDTETGNTVLHMTPKIDAGPSVAQDRVTIGPEETAVELEDRLALRGAPLVLEVIAEIAADRLQPIIQNKELVTRAPRLKKRDGAIDWSRTAAEITNQIRAMKPWPGTFTHWHRSDKEPLRLAIPHVREVPVDQMSVDQMSVDQMSVDQMPDVSSEGAPSSEPALSGATEPGTVLESTQRLVIATGDGLLSIEELQPAGKRVLSAAEFLRGYPVPVGDRFGEA